MKLEKDCWLLNRPIAHRGLWNDKITENSLSAYKNAIDNGYPIEIDLYQTVDNALFSFHDKNLMRMTGVNKNIFDLTYREVKELKLLDGDERIPTFDEVLALCENKTPLLIELKNQPSKTFVSNVLNTLQGYKGEYAIQSFNPFYVNDVRKFNDDIIRGILTAKNVENENFLTSYVVKNMPFNFLCKPDFISREYLGLPMKKYSEANISVLAWTITNESDYDKIKDYADNVIFEGFIPNE